MWFNSWKRGQGQDVKLKKWGDYEIKVFFFEENLGSLFRSYDKTWKVYPKLYWSRPIEGFRTRRHAINHLMKISGHQPWNSQQELEWMLAKKARAENQTDSPQ